MRRSSALAPLDGGLNVGRTGQARLMRENDERGLYEGEEYRYW